MELKANELRIGNLIEINAPITNKIIVVDVYHISELNENEDFFKPIPLTEEWLLKFGFEKIKSDYEEAESYDFYNENLYFNMANQSIKINGIYSISFIPEHVHQLQNLYYALTNKELTIKM